MPVNISLLKYCENAVNALPEDDLKSAYCYCIIVY